MDWTAKPNATLAELYKKRAEQIRSKYDYVVVWFSGGTDSYYMLKSFLDNGIIPDEIFSFWEFEGANKYLTVNRNDKTGANRHSEYELAAKPVLEWVAKHFPQIKITTYDITQDLFNIELDENRFLSSNHWLTVGSFARYSARSEHELAARAAGKSIGLSIGVDKIESGRDADNNFYAWFRDGPCIPDNDESRDVEYFYWSPDCPEIPVLQAHTLLAHYTQHISDLELIEQAGKRQAQVYEETYEKIIYPDYPKEFFQVDKSPFTVFNNEYDRWMLQNHGNERTVKAWEYYLNQYFPSIQSGLIHQAGGLVNLQSPKHFIGKLVLDPIF
jgi:hypothetical protein